MSRQDWIKAAEAEKIHTVQANKISKVVWLKCEKISDLLQTFLAPDCLLLTPDAYQNDFRNKSDAVGAAPKLEMITGE